MCVNANFERVRAGMVGTWLGLDSNPWTAAYQVKITFGSDGSYSAHCAQASCPAPVFYYGTDDDSSLKQYRLRAINADGTVDGQIVIVFGPNNVNTGAIESMTLSDDGQVLHFEFWATWGGRYGPITLDLKRIM
jgi:hypothetical protein